MVKNNTVPYWVNKAYEYAKKHRCIIDVSELIKDENGRYRFIATFKVNLPGKYDLEGITKTGVKKEEPVSFIFPKEFPYKAPIIYLRGDFNRNFPHINPSLENVKPCIFDGDLDELLQQPKWFDHILDQICEWFENAAANTLINPTQGWEPMRMDNVHGYILYSKEELINEIQNNSYKYSQIYYDILKLKNSTFFIANNKYKLKHKSELSKLFVFIGNQQINFYIPNFIRIYSDLHNFTQKIKLPNFNNKINEIIKNKDYKIIFIIIAVKRPYRLINSNTNIELLNFAIEIKRQKKNSKIHFKSKVYTLAHRDICTPKLLRRFSGIKATRINNIVQIGCGSLGSKICMHLARNGNDSNFYLIDSSYFFPHNNARHAAVDFGSFRSKAKLLESQLKILGVKVEIEESDVRNVVDTIKNRENNLIIDSTANIAVRNFLAISTIKSPIIHTALYSQGRLALMLVEAKNRNPRIDDLMVFIYSYSLKNKSFREKIFSENALYTSIGQGCGSYTTICPDSVISLSAAGMASKIQYYIRNEPPQEGEIFIGDISSDDMNIDWKYFICEKVEIIPAQRQDDFEVRILPVVIKNMKDISEKEFPNETGGVLLGHINMSNKTITISDLLNPPEDSKQKPNSFELGTKGLKEKIIEIERKSSGLITYVGTWHSHPRGGNASELDKNTLKRLDELRGYEPTVCLIYTPSKILKVKLETTNA